MRPRPLVRRSPSRPSPRRFARRRAAARPRRSRASTRSSRKALADQKIPGATVGVVVGDEVVLLKGYGLRDRERNRR